VFGLALRDSAAELRISKGLATLTDMRTQLEGAPLTGTARLDLAAPYRLQGNVSLSKWDLTSLQRLAPSVRLPVPVAGQFEAAVKLEGTLQPFDVKSVGTADARKLRISDLQFQDAHLVWTSDADRVSVKQIKAVLYDGEVTGSAAVPLRPTAAGAVDLHLRNLNLGALVKSLPQVPVKVQGQASGSVKGTISAAPAGKERQVTMNVDLQAPRMIVQGIPTEQLTGTVGYHQGVIDYRLQGKALGGTFDVNGEMPLTSGEPAKTGKEGRLRLKDGRLRLLAGAFGQDPATFPLRGRVDLDLRFRNPGPGFAPVGGGELVLTNLAWGLTEISDRLSADVILTGQELRLSNVSATLGDGQLRAQLGIHFKQFERSWLTLSLDRVEAARLLAPWPDLAGLIQGTLDARVRGRLGREANGSADVFVQRGRIAGVEVTEWRLPFSWAYAVREGRGELTLRDSSAQVAQGRATLQASAQWGTGLRLDGLLRFANVDLRALSRQASEGTQYVSGRLTGRFDFGGTDVRALNDLQGTLRATLGEAQALQAPALQQVAPFIGLPTSYAFNSGELSARLGRGVFRIETLALQGDVARLFVGGTVTLAGRLDLDVTARTGPVGADIGALRLLGVRVPTTGYIPLTVVTAASRYLSNRVIHLRVTGTLRSPSITLEPGALLTQEAVRFFLDRANLPLP
jgi:hypothetical protein